MMLVVLLLALALVAAVATDEKKVVVGKPCHMKSAAFAAKVKAQSRKGAVSAFSSTGAIVGAQLRCHGLMCPQWALDLSRWDFAPSCEDCSQETQLVEFLPLAPTWQRNPKIFTDYDAASRVYTVAVQSYPSEGMDTFFTASVAGDMSSAKKLLDNVIVAHPDATVNHPGSMTLIRVFDSPDPNGGVVAIFSDGSVYNLDLTSKKYTLIANIKSDPSVKATVVSNAQVFDGTVLKAFLVQSNELKSFLVTVDVSTGVVTAPVTLLPVQGGGSGTELPVNAHIIDNGQGTNILAVIMAGQFDQIIQVDEKVGTQTPIIFSITQANEMYPTMLTCDTNTKDCDTVWTTSAYDPVAKQLMVQAHYIDDQGVYWTSIYYQYWLNQVAGTFAYWDPVTLMNFGYSGYQYVDVAAGSKRAPGAARVPAVAAAAAAAPEKKAQKAEKNAEAHADLKRKLQSKSPTGTIVAAQFWKAAQSVNHELRITATYPVSTLNTPNDVNLQTLVPELSDSNQVFTAFCPDKRFMFVVVDNYPRSSSLTLWKSVLSGKADVATPVDVAVVMEYPASGSPAPLNVATPTIARLVLISGTGPTVIFSNGEAWSIDLDSKTFNKKLFSLVSQEDLYGVTHPFVTSSVVVDPAANVLHSFIFAASNVYLVTTDLTTFTVGPKIGPLDMPGSQDLSTGFSPETLINAHMITKDGSNSLLMTMESLDTTGFDELNFVNVTSGALLGPVYNLADDNVFLQCKVGPPPLMPSFAHSYLL